MFARPGRSAFVCLKCQRRITQTSQRPHWPAFDDSISRQPPKRWQSAAAAIAKDVSHHSDDPEPTEAPDPRPKFKYKGEKVWKPERTADLGVSSLGKPAEVLLLNERDRPIPEAPTEVEEGREADVLAAAWSAENSLLSPEQLIKNIEHVRDQARQRSDGEQEIQRKQLQKKLQEGFSSKQLQSYIEQKKGEATKPWRLRPPNKQFPVSVKSQMARYIFKHIWGIQGLETSEPIESEISREVVTTAMVLEVLLAADSSSLKQISLDYKVQMDFFRKPAKIIISGASNSVGKAREALRRMQEKVKVQTFSIESRSKIGPEIDMPSLRAEIRQRYGAFIVPTTQRLRVYYHEDKPPDLPEIRRHYLLAQKRAPNMSHCMAWPSSLPETGIATLHLPSGSDSIQSGSLKRLIISREQAPTPAMPQMSTDQKESFFKVNESIRDAVAHVSYSKTAVAQPGFRIETKASFGQIFTNLSNGLATPISAAVTDRNVSFRSQIPLLTQYLAERRVWKDDVREETSSYEQQAPFRYELMFSSVKDGAMQPPIKIQLTGADATRGLKQSLQIKTISAVLETKSSCLLLPSQAVDIRFESEVLRDIYREGKPIEGGHAKLLSQVAEYLNKAGSSPKSTFAPFTSFTIPSSLYLQPGSKASKRKSRRQKEEHEFILESAQALDIASFRPPFQSRLCLDHIIFIGDDRGPSRQVLQLAEHSRFDTQSQQKVSFASFFNSAYEIALSLGDRALLKKI